MGKTKMQNGFWIGIDVSKASFDAAVAPVSGKVSDWAKLPCGHFDMTIEGLQVFGQWLRPVLAENVCHGICLESTGAYSHRLVELLAPLELPVPAMVNPALPVAFRKSLGLRDKCDRVDAAVLALYGVVHCPPTNTTRAPQYKHLRSLWRLHEEYLQDILRWKNRREQALDDSMYPRIDATIDHLEKERKAVWKEIRQWVKEQPTLRRDVQLLETIPCVGEKTAIMVLAEFGDLRTWKRKEIVSYAGLYPKLFQSGTSVQRKPTLARGGGKKIRKALFMPALAAVRHNAGLSRWRARLLEKGKSRMSTIGALMRKLLVLMRGVLVSGRPYSPEKQTCAT